MPASAAGLPEKWACPVCGGALPADAQPGALLECRYCGQTVRAPSGAKGGGIEIKADQISIDGNLVSGHLVIGPAEEAPGPAAAPGERPEAPGGGIQITASRVSVGGNLVGGDLVIGPDGKAPVSSIGPGAATGTPGRPPAAGPGRPALPAPWWLQLLRALFRRRR